MSKLDDLYRALPQESLLVGERAYGRTLRVIGNNTIGCQAIGITHQLAAKAVGAVARATNLTEGRDAVDVAKATMEKFFAPIMESGAESEGCWTFMFTKCPYSLTGSSDAKLCHAIMNLEEELVRQLGGELVIEERIAEGAPKCRFTVRNR